MSLDLIGGLSASGRRRRTGGATVDVDDLFSTYLYNAEGDMDNVENGLALANSEEYAAYVAGDGKSTEIPYVKATTDYQNNIYLVMLVPNASTNGVHVIRKYTENYESLVWEQYYADGDTSSLKRIYYTHNNNLYIIHSGGSYNFVTRINPTNGSKIWSKRFTSGNSSSVRGIEEDAAGNYVYVVGSAYTASIGTGTLTGMISKLAVTDGAASWDYNYYNAGNQTQILEDVTIMDGYIYAAGYLWSGSYPKQVVVKIDSNGAIQEKRFIANVSSNTNASFYAIENDGTYIYAAGRENTAMSLTRWDANLANNLTVFHEFSNEALTPNSIHMGSDGYLYVGLNGDMVFHFNSGQNYAIARFDKSTLDVTGSGADVRRFHTQGISGAHYEFISGKGSKQIINHQGAYPGQYSYASIQLDVTKFLSIAGGKYLSAYEPHPGHAIVTGGSEGAFTMNAPINTDQTWSNNSPYGAPSVELTTPAVDIYHQPAVTDVPSTEPALVWFADRNAINDKTMVINSASNYSFGGGPRIYRSNSSAIDAQGDSYIRSWGVNGFTVGGSNATGASGREYCAWTFKRAPNFFDIVYYTGDGSGDQTISHNLESTPGFILIKQYDGASNWWSYHKDHSSATDGGRLNSTAVWSTNGSYGALAGHPTDTEFRAGINTTGLGTRYVAFLFASNEGQGTFGPNGDQDIIKCGSYSGSSGLPKEINCGFEAQWVLIKNTVGSANDWVVYDFIRGMSTSEAGGGTSPAMPVNTTTNEPATPGFRVYPTANGFEFYDTVSNTNWVDTAYEYVFVAIGKSSKVPTDSADVFSVRYRDGAGSSGGAAPENASYIAPHRVDMALTKDVDTVVSWNFSIRKMADDYLFTNSNIAASRNNTDYTYDWNRGFGSNTVSDATKWSWMWKSAKGFFDTQIFRGDGNGLNTINHNLGAVPKMIWLKGTEVSHSWVVYHSGMGRDILRLEQTADATPATSSYWYSDPTETAVEIGGTLNVAGREYMVCLFGEIPGVTSFGTYTGTSTPQTIDCGFTKGSKFVFIKKSVGADSDWFISTSAIYPGIASGNDFYIRPNSNGIQTTSIDIIDPDPSGFILPDAYTNVNLSGETYVYYAISN